MRLSGWQFRLVNASAMSASRRSVIVSRKYQAAPDHCARALELLLKQPVSEKAAGTSGGEDHARKEIHGSRAGRIVPEKDT